MLRASRDPDTNTLSVGPAPGGSRALPVPPDPVPDTVGERVFAPPSLTGRNVHLRPIMPRDFEFLQTIETTGDLATRWRFAGATPSPEQWMKQTFDGVLAQFIVVARETSQPVGIVAVYQPDFMHGHASLAAARFEPGQRSPLLMLGLAIFLRYVFTCWDLRKLYMDLPEYNYAQFSSGASRYFELEGRRKAHTYFGGEWWDHLTLAVYRDAWLEHGDALLRAEAR